MLLLGLLTHHRDLHLTQDPAGKPTYATARWAFTHHFVIVFWG